MTATMGRQSYERIETVDGVVLRRPIVGDAAGVRAGHGDPAVYTHDPQEVHPDVAHSERFLRPMIGHWAAHGFGYWSVLVPAVWWREGITSADAADGDRVLAGLGGIQHHRVQGVPVLNVYYRFAVPTQGRGLARTVIEQALVVAPRVAPGVDLVVRTRPANGVARHVAERAGFVDEGLEPSTTDMQLLRHRAPAVE